MANQILEVFSEHLPIAELCKSLNPHSKVGAVKTYRDRVPEASLLQALDAINAVW